jgi:hypothetical protein
MKIRPAAIRLTRPASRTNGLRTSESPTAARPWDGTYTGPVVSLPPPQAVPPVMCPPAHRSAIQSDSTPTPERQTDRQTDRERERANRSVIGKRSYLSSCESFCDPLTEIAVTIHSLHTAGEQVPPLHRSFIIHQHVVEACPSPERERNKWYVGKARQLKRGRLGGGGGSGGGAGWGGASRQSGVGGW